MYSIKINSNEVILPLILKGVFQYESNEVTKLMCELSKLGSITLKNRVATQMLRRVELLLNKENIKYTVEL